MRCYLVRHAQTGWNGENRLQGRADRRLSPLGREQAACVGNYFASLPTMAPSRWTLYTSHLQRSVQTAHAIARRTGLTPRIEPALAEIGLGSWEGLTPEEVDTRFAGAYRRWQTTPSDVQIPGGEPLAAFRARVRRAFARIAAAHQGEGTLILVTHGGVIASLLADCLEAEYDRVLQGVVLENGGISALNANTHPPDVLWVNTTDHLVRGAEGPPAHTPEASGHPSIPC